jgi:hypothetical protein
LVRTGGLRLQLLRDRLKLSLIMFDEGTGVHGNTHFPFSDTNNREIDDLLSGFLKKKGLDQ